MITRTMVLLLALVSTEEACAPKAGTVAGSAGFFDSQSLKFVADASNVTVELTSNGTRITLRADELGDFHAALPPGKYVLDRVVDSSGRSLPIPGIQVREFVIEPKRHTRFDIMIEKSKESEVLLEPQSTP